jgi:hypothetical protein
MATQNTTFKLTDDELALLEGLAADMKCSRTQVIRRGLAELDQLRQTRHEVARRFIDRLHARIPKGKTLMIGLDGDGQPFATINGAERLDDVVVRGRKITSGKEEFVVVRLCDPEHDLELEVGAIRVQTGGWLAVLDPLPVNLAWADT